MLVYSRYNSNSTREGSDELTILNSSLPNLEEVEENKVLITENIILGLNNKTCFDIINERLLILVLNY